MRTTKDKQYEDAMEKAAENITVGSPTIGAAKKLMENPYVAERNLSKPQFNEYLNRHPEVEVVKNFDGSTSYVHRATSFLDMSGGQDYRNKF